MHWAAMKNKPGRCPWLSQFSSFHSLALTMWNNASTKILPKTTCFRVSSLGNALFPNDEIMAVKQVKDGHTFGSTMEPFFFS